MDMEQLGPQNFLYGCELKAGKEVTFNPEDDEFEHQLSLRMVCVDSSTKDELHVVEVEGHNSEGEEVKAIVATLKPSSLPSVCLGGFEISPPAVFRLKSGSGPVHISGQHLIMADADQSFDEDDDEDEEEVKTSLKRQALPSMVKPQKKIKMDEEADDEDDDEDDEDDDDDEEEDKDSEEEQEDSPVKPKKTPSKSPAQNGKTPKAAAPTPTGKQTAKAKTPDSKGKTPKGTPKTPQTPRTPLTMEEVQNKMKSNVEKGVMLPKVEAKFENYVKNGFHVQDAKMIQELWKWRQTVKDRK
ncbi:hypothetical protein SKAU_G00083320 [Synaphobranchus kaupii]|uniref:Nucleophosmin n=1 Tax=Synaphobranchus kaupii TaxID=118154 RepID=A0A9Q1FUW7_SYNKA|nr:hypothetical protein SKAU_G00083320 [Synaphobranchus kaupii]